MKIKDLLLLGPGINNYLKKLSLSYLLDININDLYFIENDINFDIIEKYKDILNRLKKEPIQYIFNRANFYGYDFYVDKNVLIPRPETELLIEKTNNLINKYFKGDVAILDIGTGSGCIAITLSKLNTSYVIDAVDISTDALNVAKKNNARLCSSVNFFQSDLFSNVKKKYDVVISNPPYLDFNSTMVEKIVRNNEPSLALFGDDNGIKYYNDILSNIKKYLNDKFIIAFEIGDNQGEKILTIAKKYFPNCNCFYENDFNNLNRYFFIINE